MSYMFRGIWTLAAALVFGEALIFAGCGEGSAARRSPVRPGQAVRIPEDTAEKKDEVRSDTHHRATQSTRARRGSWSLNSEKVMAVADIVRDAARRYGLSEDLVFGMIWVESRFNPKAVSPVGARGLMQLMPRTAQYLAERIEWPGPVDAFDPHFNIEAGTYYIARLIDSFEGDVVLALAAYNAGPGAVRRWLGEDGLPEISVEYAAMVETARGFFEGSGGDGAPPGGEEAPITNEELDRLGLSILIAGLSEEPSRAERIDSADPFDDRVSR